MEMREWYESLKKPSWAPKPEIFGRVWSVLYLIIFAVNAYVIILLARGTISWLVAMIFWLNLIFNIAYTPIQFGLRNQLLSVISIVLVLVTTAWAMVVIYPYSIIACLAFIPYLLWVGIATVLQVKIWWLNR